MIRNFKNENIGSSQYNRLSEEVFNIFMLN